MMGWTRYTQRERQSSCRLTPKRRDQDVDEKAVDDGEGLS
jgi:hypothetical protein